MFDFFKRMGAKAQAQMVKGLVKEYVTPENVNTILANLADFQAQKEAEAGAPLFITVYRNEAGHLVLAVYKHENGVSVSYTSYTISNTDDIIQIASAFFPEKTENNDSKLSGPAAAPSIHEDERGKYVEREGRKFYLNHTYSEGDTGEPTDTSDAGEHATATAS